ncbi:chemotaxis protein CheW [Roseomonas sp. JC162]|uniref:Chemotaxis protein CheW n=1 Tax=Neoroseomonas marina TaxID=1232220 RepID=A0A848EFX7_9PROT|nr:chemotaxis protein CheW [Neoroseomonas marina]NMJ42896.1 chemotaxis protein CheW [Neoroseomonas marina]
MTAEPEALALRAGMRCFLLPPRSRRLEAPPAPRPVPGAPPGLLGLAMVDRRGAMVWALTPFPSAWVVVERDGGAVVCGGDAVTEPTADAVPLALPEATPLPMPAPVALSIPPRPAAMPLAAPRSRDHYLLTHGTGSVSVPLAALEGMGSLRPGMDPATPPGLPGAFGIHEVAGRRVLVLDPAWCTGGRPATGMASGLVALLRIDGRLLAMPIGRAAPGMEGPALEERLRETPDGRALLDAAPHALPAAGPEAGREVARLLLCEAGGTRFAVVAAEIATVLAPLRPAPAPAPVPSLRGVVSHRGEVLPVHDLDPRLGPPLLAPALAQAPLLRLALPRPVAVPVERVLGLRALPAALIEAVADDVLVSGLAPLDGMGVRICRAAALPA